MNSFAFPKRERLSGENEFTKLHTSGSKQFLYPFLLYYKLRTDADCSRVLISVPKKHFRKAVVRNLLRRKVKEAYRLDPFRFQSNKYDLAIIVIAKEVVNYGLIQKKLRSLLSRLN